METLHRYRQILQVTCQIKPASVYLNTL